MAEQARNRELDEAMAALRRFLRSRWEERDADFFRTTTPVPAVATPAPRPGLRTSAPPPAPAPRAAAFRPPAPRPASAPARPGGARPAPARPQRAPLPLSAFPDYAGRRPTVAKPAPKVERHESGILNPDASEKGKALLELWEKTRNCEGCGLCKGRQHFVFGTGSPEARVVFVGEAPGEQEDKQGLPFVGPAGRLLTDMLTGIGLDRDEVFICNVLKCRPPGNRKPELPEIEVCEQHLFNQVRIIAPKVLVALGTFAAQSLMQTNAPIGRLRGRWIRWKDSDLLATYHPSAGLRAGSFRKVIEEDFQLLKKRLESGKPGKP